MTVNGDLGKQAIRTLRANRNIIIKPADKGSKIVLLDVQQYALEANRQLENTKYYKQIPRSIQPLTLTLIRDIIQDLYAQKALTAKQRDFLFGPDDPRDRLFYLLPKIHKDPSTWMVPNAVPPGRPIVSDCSNATYNVLLYIDLFLGPLSTKHPSYLKDAYHFLNVLRLLKLPPGTCLFTLDVDSLYTNIGHGHGLTNGEKNIRALPG